jgi:hypothetical protein
MGCGIGDDGKCVSDWPIFRLMNPILGVSPVTGGSFGRFQTVPSCTPKISFADSSNSQIVMPACALQSKDIYPRNIQGPGKGDRHSFPIEMMQAYQNHRLLDFRETKGTVRLHTLLDLRGNVTSFIHISDGKLHEVNVLDIIPLEAGAFYIMDRGFLDFSRLHAVTTASAFFVIRAKSNLKSRRLYSHPVDKKSTVVVCDQSILLTVPKSAGDYPDKLRRVRYYDAETDKTLVFLTNNFLLHAITIAQLYKQRWQVELFFKWIKQNLRIKSFYGTSENAVKTQIWIAVSVYLIVAIIKKRINIQESLYTILQVLSVSIFGRTSMFQLLTYCDHINDLGSNANQPNLFTDYFGQ